MGKIYIGDEGTELIVDCGSDISSATVHVIKVRFPDGTEESWSADIYNTNYLKRVLDDDDLSQTGEHFGQAYVETPSGKWSGETFAFDVERLWG